MTVLEVLESGSCFGLVAGVGKAVEARQQVVALKHGFVHVSEGGTPPSSRRSISADARPVDDAEELAFQRYIAVYHFSHRATCSTRGSATPMSPFSSPVTPTGARDKLLELATLPAAAAEASPRCGGSPLPDTPSTAAGTPRPTFSSQLSASAACWTPPPMKADSRLRAEAPAFVPHHATPSPLQQPTPQHTAQAPTMKQLSASPVSSPHHGNRDAARPQDSRPTQAGAHRPPPPPPLSAPAVGLLPRVEATPPVPRKCSLDTSLSPAERKSSHNSSAQKLTQVFLAERQSADGPGKAWSQEAVVDGEALGRGSSTASLGSSAPTASVHSFGQGDEACASPPARAPSGQWADVVDCDDDVSEWRPWTRDYQQEWRQQQPAAKVKATKKASRNSNSGSGGGLGGGGSRLVWRVKAHAVA